MANTPGGGGGENPLYKTWHDSAWMPVLNQTNVMDYFAERSNTFYDRTCNNEVVKMQRLHPENLVNMTGIEYILLHVQEPILYIIRKQHRHSPTQVSPLTDYYIIGGVVYQAPDLCSVISSRMLNTIHNLESAFSEAQSYSRYHPSKGYWWELKDKTEDKKEEKKKKEEPSSMFQRQRVDDLLVTLAAKFPPPTPASTAPTTAPPTSTANTAPNTKTADTNNTDTPAVKTEIKTEPKAAPSVRSSTGPPPEKKQKVLR